MRTLRFCFDFLSPYAYLAWTQLGRIAERHGASVEPVPILLAALLDAHDTRGPAEVPARRRYVIHDAVRVARAFGVPITLPPAHPFNSLLALRVASLPMTDDQRRALVDALFRAVWAAGRDVTDAKVVGEVVAQVGAPVSVDAATDAAKARVRAQTEAALRDGAFGVPTIYCDGQMFFGCDSLPHLERFLVDGQVTDPAFVERWERLPVGAVRAARRPYPA
jgi:2-hydroxychromene-2-carboxylate isomerase